jgi:hypothetical protein
MVAGRVYGPAMTSTIHYTAPAARPFVEFGQVQADALAGLGLLAAEYADEAIIFEAVGDKRRLAVAERRLRKTINAWNVIATTWPTFGPGRP